MVVFFDIDGTIVDDRTQIIPQSAVDAIHALRENGHIAVINSGRPVSHVDPRVRAMDFAGFIGGCGMEVLYGDQWLSRQQPDLELCRYARDSIRECNMQVLFEQREGAILTDGKWSSHPGCRGEAERMRKKGSPILEIDSLPQPQFMKFVTLDGLENCRREEFLQRMEPHFNYIVRNHTLVEYMGKGCSKAGGMQLLLQHLGIPQEETLAIGDSTNDLPMFLAAGHTACMGDGMEELKDRSEYITGSVLEDGLSQALRHFKLI